MQYDPTRQSLLHPEAAPTLFAAGTRYSMDAICAECSRLAYIRFDAGSPDASSLPDALGLAGLGQVRLFSDEATGTAAFSAIDASGARAIVAFRGTQPDDLSDLGTDANIVLSAWKGDGKVHRGFQAAFDNVWGQIGAWLAQTPAQEVWMTGHSLGAALATLAAALKPTANLVNFGSPRVGDETFAAQFAGRNVRRYVDCCDLVTALPPAAIGYAHVSGQCYIDRNGVIAADISEADISMDRAAARMAYLTAQGWRTGNVGIRDLADHAPINYVSAVMGLRTIG